jgi:antitoxin component YwqK of YwqJK toxin-antitoxin module
MFKNGNLQYYCRYKDGYSDGENVTFYENGSKKSSGMMYRDVRHGITTYWYENGMRKSEISYKYSIVISTINWDDDGKLLEQKKKELTDFERKLIERYDSLE